MARSRRSIRLTMIKLTGRNAISSGDCIGGEERVLRSVSYRARWKCLCLSRVAKLDWIFHSKLQWNVSSRYFDGQRPLLIKESCNNLIEGYRAVGLRQPKFCRGGETT